MLQLGLFNLLTVLRSTSVGLFLGDDEGNEVLLPNKYVTPGTLISDNVEVFIYTDSEDRPIATNLVPTIQLHQFEVLVCKDTSDYGAFLDWGLEKDVFVPYREQREKMKVGESYLVYLYVDERSNRLIASSKVNKFLSNDYLSVSENDEVDLIITDKSQLGYNVIINGVHSGLLYDNEVFKELYYGERTKGYVSKIREDKKIDVRLYKSGVKAIVDNAEFLLKKLDETNGFLNLNDKSSAEEIYQRLHISKKQFKKAVGNLLKVGKVEITENGIVRKG
jgi:uncharacterized protein